MLEEDEILDFEAEEKEYELAKLNQRGFNRLVDMILIGIAFSVVTGIFPEINSDFRLRLDRISLDLTDFFLEAIQMLVYYAAFEYLFGQSPGKLLTRTKVLTKEGAPPTLGKIIIRSLCRSIPFNFVSVLTNQNAVGWHDMISGTRVVQL